MPSYVQDPLHAATTNSITPWKDPASEVLSCESKCAFIIAHAADVRRGSPQASWVRRTPPGLLAICCWLPPPETSCTSMGVRAIIPIGENVTAAFLLSRSQSRGGVLLYENIVAYATTTERGSLRDPHHNHTAWQVA